MSVARMETVWRVCRTITGDCKQCPATEELCGEPCTRGCYMQAAECVNVVETGNPWRKTGDVKAPWVALPSPTEGGWRPIETAPQGVPVLLFSPDAEEPQVMLAHLLEFDGDPEGARWFDYWNDSSGAIDADPTHWQPLPASPDPVLKEGHVERPEPTELAAQSAAITGAEVSGNDDGIHIATIVLTARPDGGLRVHSDDLPGLILSGHDPDTVAATIWPAIRALAWRKALVGPRLLKIAGEEG